ncbi:hypothetical protein FHS96_000311 [Sphingomonas zeicaulis]|uniref:hypothetical protein n=1 Tax=Sphingomonas zeicaulis TaxID=1632740 RepID=UPI003D25F7DD
MNATQLHNHIVTTLLRRVGGNQRRWRQVLGPLQIHDRATHPHCNWSLHPTGSAGEISAVETLLDTVRLEHPLVSER